MDAGPPANGGAQPMEVDPQAAATPRLPSAAPGSGGPSPGEAVQGAGHAAGTPAGEAGGAAPAPKARSIKTPVQKEALEAAYQVNKFPDEAMRRAVGERIGLTEAQVQVWFSHKRRKEKKDQEDAAVRAVLEQKHAEERQQQEAAAAAAPAPAAAAAAAAAGPASAPPAAPAAPAPEQPAAAAQPPQAAGAPDQAAAASPAAPASGPRPANAPPPVWQPTASAPPAAGARPAGTGTNPSAAAANLGFSASPKPAAAPRAAPKAQGLTAEQRAEVQALLVAARALMPVPYREDGPLLVLDFDDPPTIRADGTYADEEPSGKRKRVDGDDDGRPRGPPGSRAELERAERERRREADRAEKEQRRQEVARAREEVKLRALQEKEERKAQAQAEKDRRAQERKDKLEEKRKEKEMLKQLQQQERVAARRREANGPKDDLDLEWEGLLAAQREQGYASGTEGGGGGGPPPPVRPPFPPAGVSLGPLWPPPLEGEPGADLLAAWSFLAGFSELLGLGPVSVGQLLRALLAGERSRLLSDVHCALLRLVQADMEEAHATGAMQSGSAMNFLDRSVVSSAQALEGAAAWGFDVDAWRAHLNALTWPEVLRQMAVTWGMGPKRPKARKEARQRMGTVGEDVVADDAGGLKLRLPSRFASGTVKAAAWHVLADEGPEGLPVSEIARRIQAQGLRDLRSSRPPEERHELNPSSVAGALSRDVTFARLEHSVYALQSIVNHHAKLKGRHVGAPSREASAAPEAGEAHAGGEEEEEEHSGSEDEDEEEAEEPSAAKGAEGAAWVRALKGGEYSALTLPERCAALAALVRLAVEGPTLRGTMDGRMEEVARVRKAMFEEARLEKKRRQEAAAAKAKLVQEEAARVLELARQAKEGSVAPSETGEAGGPAGPHPGSAAPGEGGERQSPAAPAPAPKGGKGKAAKAASKSASREPSEQPGVKREPGDGKPAGPEADDEFNSAVAIKQRQLQRTETIRRAEEANAVRTEPLGLDRRHNRYWHFAGEQAGADFAGRVLFESHEDGAFRLLGSAESLDALISALDKRGARESILHASLTRDRDALARAMPATPFKMPQAPEEDERAAALDAIPSAAARKLKSRAPSAGAGGGGDPAAARVRRDMVAVAKALPKDATAAEWDAGAWQKRVKAAADVEALRGLLAELEGVLQPDFLSPHFSRTPLLVRGAWLPTGWEVASALPGPHGEVQRLAQVVTQTEEGEPPPPLAWLPLTLPALALRLQALDASLIYTRGGAPAREVTWAYRYTQRPAGLAQKAPKAVRAATLSGQPVGRHGRALTTLMPPFPQALLQGERRAFSMDWAKLRKEIADEEAGIIPPPTVPARGPGRGRPKKPPPRGNAKPAKARGGKKGRSAARQEFEGESDEEEAAERRGLTPSDDDSDFLDGPVGRSHKQANDDMEISD